MSASHSESEQQATTTTNTRNEDSRIVSEGEGNVNLTGNSQFSQNISFDKNVADLLGDTLGGVGDTINKTFINSIGFAEKALDVASKSNADAIDAGLEGTQRIANRAIDEQSNLTRRVLDVTVDESKSIITRVAPFAVVAVLGFAGISMLGRGK